MAKLPIDTDNLKITFGKYSGELVTRLPLSYLKWLVNVQASGSINDMPAHKAAKAELDRRGTPEPIDVEVSGHALDRLSTRFPDAYAKHHKKDEGFWTWAHRMALEALKRAARNQKVVKYKKIQWVFTYDCVNPVLRTVK